jgi:hypothetical protein
MTPLQTKMLIRIAEDELAPGNGAEPSVKEDATTYADCVIEDAEDKGVFTSLLNAGMVWHTGKGRDAGVGLTDSGFAAYKSHKRAEANAH